MARTNLRIILFLIFASSGGFLFGYVSRLPVASDSQAHTVRLSGHWSNQFMLGHAAIVSLHNVQCLLASDLFLQRPTLW